LHQQRTAALQEVLERFHRESKFPGAVAGAWFADSSTIVVAVGTADRDRATPMLPEALLHAGSVGKTLFAGLALQLIGEGRLTLDEKVSRYLGTEPWYAQIPNADAITVRMLLNHTSGIPEYGSDFMRSLIRDPGESDHRSRRCSPSPGRDPCSRPVSGLRIPMSIINCCSWWKRRSRERVRTQKSDAEYSNRSV
jgi:CubicO group peptidase (beta-lactamase class C family)